MLRFERELLDYLKRNTSILDTLRETNVLDDDTVAELDKVTDAFILEFQGGKGQAISKPGHEVASARGRRQPPGRSSGSPRPGPGIPRYRTSMGAQLRVYKQGIASAQTTKKITKAMELIAASRIQKAKARVAVRRCAPRRSAGRRSDGPRTHPICTSASTRARGSCRAGGQDSTPGR